MQLDVTARLKGIPRPLVVPLGLVILALVGWADYLAGYHMSFSLFYLLPICLVAARTGRLGGVTMSVLAALVLLAVEASLRPWEMTTPVLIWNAALRWGFFVSIALGLVENQRALRETEVVNAKLAGVNGELAAANQELEAFVRAAAHDLRSPLTVVGGFANLLLKRGANTTDEEARDYLELIYGNVQRAERLLEAMLNFARAGRAALRPANVDLSSVARRIADSLAGADQKRQVEFRIAPGVEARADPDLVYVALQNLLGNAWKYTSMAPRAEVEFGVLGEAASGEPPVYYVKDNGVGFDMTFADKLFLPFTRLHSAEQFGGSGIGLSTVKRIVERHGGRIWAEGAVGKGATFYFTL